MICQQIAKLKFNQDTKDVLNTLKTMEKNEPETDKREEKLKALMMQNCFKNIKEDVIKEATADLVKVMAGEEMPIKEKYNKLYDFVGIQDLYKNNKEKDIDLIIESFNKNAENYIKLESDGGIENDTPLIARKGEIGIFGISVKNMGVFKVIAACVFFGLFFIGVIFFLLKMNKTKKKGKNKKNK